MQFVVRQLLQNLDSLGSSALAVEGKSIGDSAVHILRRLIVGFFRQTMSFGRVVLN